MDRALLIKSILIYLGCINVVAALAAMTDKAAAIAGNSRVRERTLFLLGAFGGASLMFFTMLLIRHKTKHKRFMIGLPLIMIVQYIITFLLHKYAYPLLP